MTDCAKPLDDPDAAFRRGRKSQKAKGKERLPSRSESQSGDRSWEAVPDVDDTLLEVTRRLQEEIAQRYIDERAPPLRPGSNPEQLPYSTWGYLPPFDEEALAVIEAIMADPAMAKTLERIGPQHEDFPPGLQQRNVSLEASTIPDPYEDHVHQLESKEFVLETTEERTSSEQLWKLDRAKCIDGTNEALFQRTVMMNLIARHRLMHDPDRDAESRSRLDYSVEEAWTCPPMPSRAHWMRTNLLTQPKPDLAVFFRRSELIPDETWSWMPSATQRLACIEGRGMIGRSRVFHFFTIESKKASTPTGSFVGQLQSLNNASQALHNMFEFFQDAGKSHQKAFFDKVRFFSAVASSEGLTIRIHRATRVSSNGSRKGLIMEDRPDYPLRFEYREFATIPKDKFDRIPVLELFEKILLRYGAEELHPLLKGAAEALMERLGKDHGEIALRADVNFYRHGQIFLPKSRKQTPTGLTTSSLPRMALDGPQSRASMGPPRRPRLKTNVSANMLENGTKTPTQPTQPTQFTQDQPLASPQPSKGVQKRGRGRPKKSAPVRNTRPRIE